MKAVVTAITNCYDRLKQAPETKFDWEYICFMDAATYLIHRDMGWVNVIASGKTLYLNGWKYIPMPHNTSDRDIKILTHKYLPEYKEFIWCDGSIWLIDDPEYIRAAARNREVLLMEHPKRYSAFEEIEYCIENEIGDSEILTKQMIEYADVDCPGLYEMGLHYKRITSRTIGLMGDWYSEWKKFPSRDQPAFSMASLQYRRDHRGMFASKSWRFLKGYVSKSYHIKKIIESDYPVERKDPQIVYINLLEKNANIGKYINDLALKCDDDTWLCVTDADTAFLNTSHVDCIIRKAIRTRPSADIFCAYTNRSGIAYQVYKRELFGEKSIIPHKLIADHLAAKPISCTEMYAPVAGFCLIFPASLTYDVPFMNHIEEDGMFWDWKFGKDALEHGKRIFRIDNLYIYHYYRLLEGETNISHIMNA